MTSDEAIGLRVVMHKVTTRLSRHFLDLVAQTLQPAATEQLAAVRCHMLYGCRCSFGACVRARARSSSHCCARRRSSCARQLASAHTGAKLEKYRHIVSRASEDAYLGATSLPPSATAVLLQAALARASILYEMLDRPSEAVSVIEFAVSRAEHADLTNQVEARMLLSSARGTLADMQAKQAGATPASSLTPAAPPQASTPASSTGLGRRAVLAPAADERMAPAAASLPRENSGEVDQLRRRLEQAELAVRCVACVRVGVCLHATPRSCVSATWRLSSAARRRCASRSASGSWRW